MTCSGITGRGRGKVLPRNFSMGNFCWPTVKKGARKKGKKGVRKWKGGGKEAKFEREEVENWKCKGIGMKMSRSPPPFFFFFFLLVTFWNHSNLFGVYQNGQICREKSYFTPGKKIGKTDFAPLWKIFFLHTPDDMNQKILTEKVISKISVDSNFTYVTQSRGMSHMSAIFNFDFFNINHLPI